MTVMDDIEYDIGEILHVDWNSIERMTNYYLVTIEDGLTGDELLNFLYKYKVSEINSGPRKTMRIYVTGHR